MKLMIDTEIVCEELLELKITNPPLGMESWYIDGWNDCIDEVTRIVRGEHRDPHR